MSSRIAEIDLSKETGSSFSPVDVTNVRGGSRRNGEIDVTNKTRISILAEASNQDQVLQVRARHSASGVWLPICPELGGKIPSGEAHYKLGGPTAGFSIEPYDRLQLRAKYDTSSGGTINLYGQIWQGKGPVADTRRRGVRTISNGGQQNVAEFIVPPGCTQIHVAQSGPSTDTRLFFMETANFNNGIGAANGPSGLNNDAGTYNKGIPTPFVRLRLQDAASTNADRPWQLRAIT